MLGRLGWIRGRLLSRCLSCNRKCLCAAFFPKALGDLQRFDIRVVPPGHFVTGLMQLLMVITAERHGDPIWTLRFCSFYAASALSAILGFLATIVSSARAAGSGSTRPCSQFRSVDSGMRSALENSDCVIPRCFRRICGGMTGAKLERSPAWLSLIHI